MLSTNSHHLCKAILFLSLIFLFFHGHCSLSISNRSKHHHVMTSKNKLRSSMVHRKVLPSKFDFTPFLHHLPKPGPPGDKIDPLYGDEKRRVPTGPNPLHH